MKTLDSRARCVPIDVPREIATCPICNVGVVIKEVHEWECDGGKPVGISVDCTTEPDVDSSNWCGWFYEHWSMPYLDWLPVENRVLKWFQANYRCEVSPGAPGKEG